MAVNKQDDAQVSDPQDAPRPALTKIHYDSYGLGSIMLKMIEFLGENRPVFLGLQRR